MDLLNLPGTAFNALLNVLNSNQTKNVILDPFTTLIRLAILAVLPKGTKIGIYNHQITFYTPKSLQGILRFVRGDKRSDLHNLYLPIKKATEWYDRSDEKISFILKQAHIGLVNLKDNYHTNGSNSDNSTYLSLGIFDGILMGKQQEIYDSVTPERAELLKREIELSSDNLIHTQLKKIWTQHDINVVYDLLQKINIEDDIISKNKLINVINIFLESKDNQVQQIVEKNTFSL
jgi:hypothetical protein